MGLDALVERISRRAKDGTWQVSVDEIRELSGLEFAEFYSVAYRLHNRLDSSMHRFSHETVGELVTLLEAVFGPAAEQRMARAGLFVPHELGNELVARFWTVVAERVRRHRVDEATFLAMLQTFRTYDEARGVYLDEYFARDEIIRAAANAFVREFPFDDPETAATTCMAHLSMLFLRHVLSLRAALRPVTDRLTRIALEHGFLHRRERVHYYDSAEKPGPDDAVTDGLRLLGLAGTTPDSGMLKRRYKELMKRYHPDVNPAGLETCKRINNAYSYLLARIG